MTSSHELDSAAISHGDREGVYSLFSDPDFMYRTASPVVLDAHAIDRLLGDRTMVILHRGEAVGLWSFSSAFPLYSRHVPVYSGIYLLDYRLSSAAPSEWWTVGYQQILEFLGSKSDVVRVTMRVPEFDRLGQAAAVRMGLRFEGEIGQALQWNGRSWANRVYGQVQPPDVFHDAVPGRFPGQSSRNDEGSCHGN